MSYTLSMIPTAHTIFLFFFFNDTATTEIYTLSPTRRSSDLLFECRGQIIEYQLHLVGDDVGKRDRKSTRLNSSHLGISYAVFCLKKKKKKSRDSVSLIRNILDVFLLRCRKTRSWMDQKMLIV